jgi:2-hydroxymuconate-semialdehyde hydrolase
LRFALAGHKGIIISRINSNNIMVNGLDIHYLQGGEGYPLVVVHGGGGGTTAWLNSLELLSEYYSVYAPDLPGFGGSESIDDRFSIPEYVDFLDSFVDELGLRRFHLIGHSVGGGLALKLALKAPNKIEKLVLVSSLFLGKEIAFWARCFSSLSVFRWMAESLLAVFRVVAWIARHLSPSRILSPPFSRVQMALGRSIMAVEGQTTVLSDQLSGLIMPTLLVWGARDGIVPMKHARSAAGLIPDCQVHVFGDCGHNVHNSKSRPFSQLVTRFLGDCAVR